MEIEGKYDEIGGKIAMKDSDDEGEVLGKGIWENRNSEIDLPCKIIFLNCNVNLEIDTR